MFLLSVKINKCVEKSQIGLLLNHYFVKVSYFINRLSHILVTDINPDTSILRQKSDHIVKKNVEGLFIQIFYIDLVQFIRRVFF